MVSSVLQCRALVMGLGWKKGRNEHKYVGEHWFQINGGYYTSF